MIRVTIYNEFFHEKNDPRAEAVYPHGIHRVIGDFLEEDSDITVNYVHLDNIKEKMTEELLRETDVLIWWAHANHPAVPDEIALMVADEVCRGMGFIPLHAAHHSKPFKLLMGTRCDLLWELPDRERVWTVKPGHPIAKDVPMYFELDKEEMYGEPFTIPEPEEIIFMGWFSGGNLFRSGCTFKRQNGKIFYFQPGHEIYPTYYNENVQKIILNAVKWTYNEYRAKSLGCERFSRLEK